MRTYLLCFFLLFRTLAGQSQSDSCTLRITLLTCSPGEELYSTFGHTAIRVQDAASATDEVFNYGMFSFGPDFYPKFIRGKLLYSLAVESFPEFLYTYQYEGRSVVEQELQLPCARKQALWAALRENAREENRHYRYDFLFDNCTTRARDMIRRHTGAPVAVGDILAPDAPTFRNLLHTYLDRGGQYWSKLGIDLLLGARLDRKVSNEEAQFLPDYLLKAMDHTTVNSKPLATKPLPVLQIPSPLNAGSLFRPAIVFTLLLLVIGALSLVRNKAVQGAVILFDRFFFLVVGLAGFLLLFMWIGTDHKVCRDNLNLLWALPTHAAAAFFLHRRTTSVQHYFKAVFWMNVLLVACWLLLPQALNPALLPLILLLIWRSWHHAKPQPHAHPRN